MAAKTEQQLLISIIGKLDKSITSAFTQLNDSMLKVQVVLNKVYNVSSRLEGQLGGLAGKLTSTGQAADAQASSMTRLSSQTQAYSEAVKKLSAQNTAAGIKEGSTAWNEQFTALGKLEKQLYKTSRTMGTAGNAWYKSQDRLALLNKTMENGENSTGSYLKAIQKVGSYGTVYANAVKRAAEQYGAGTAQFEVVAKGIKNVAASQAIASTRADQLGTSWKRLTSSRQVLAQAEQNASGATKMTRDGLVAVNTAAVQTASGLNASQKATQNYAKGLKDLGVYGRQYQEAAVAVSKTYGHDSAMYAALYKNIKSVGESQLQAASRAKTMGTSYKGLTDSATVLNEAVSKHGKVQTTAAAEMAKTIGAGKTQTGIFGSLGTAVGRVTSSLKTMASYAIATALITGFYKAAAAVVTYDQSLHNLKAISGATDSEMQNMGSTLKDVSSNSRISIDKIADGMTNIAQAGFSATETMQTIGAATDLATGTMSDLGKSTDLLTTIIRAFNMDASQAATVADALAVSVNKSKLDIEKLNTIFNYVGVAAKAAGVSFKDATASTMALANAGFKASTIGTGMRQILQVLSQGSTKFSTAIVKAGMNLSDFDLKTKSYGEVLENLGTLLNKGANFYDVFSTRAGNAAIQLATSAQQVREFSKALNEVGAAQQMAQTQMEGLGAKIELMQNKFRVLMATLADNGLTSVFSTIIDTINSLITVLTTLADSKFTKLIIVLGEVVIALGLATTAFRTLAWAMSLGTLATWTSGIVAATGSFLGLSGAAAGTGTAVATLMGIPVWGWIAAGVIAVGSLAYGLSNMGESLSDVSRKHTKLASDLGQQITTLDRYKKSIEGADQGSVYWRQQTSLLLTQFPELAGKIDLARASTADYIRVINELSNTKTTAHTAAMRTALEADIKMFQDANKRISSIGQPGSYVEAGDAAVVPSNEDNAKEKQAAEAQRVSSIQSASNAMKVLEADTSAVGRANLEAFKAALPAEMARAVRDLQTSTKTAAVNVGEMAAAQTRVQEALNGVDSGQLKQTYADISRAAETATGEAKDNAKRLKAGYDEAALAMEDANDKTEKLLQEKKITKAQAEQAELDATKAFNSTIQGLYAKPYEEELAVIKEKAAEKQAALAAENDQTDEGNRKMKEETTKLEVETANKIIDVYVRMMVELRKVFGEQFTVDVVAQTPKMIELTKEQTAATNSLAAKTNAHSRAVNSLTGAHGDLFKAEKKHIANLKSIMSLEESKSNLAVAKGEIAAEEAALAVLARKLEIAKEYVATTEQMLGKAKSETDRETAEKENNAAIKEQLDLETSVIQEKKKIRKEGAEAQIALTESVNNREIASMDNMVTHYTQIEAKKHASKVNTLNAEVANLTTQVNQEKEGSNARLQLEADLNNKKADLASEFVRYEQSLYEERMKYMDEYYKYGLMSTEEYVSLLKKQYNSGQISALEFEKKRITASGSFYEQAKLGVAEWIAEQKSAGEQVVDLMKGTLDDIKSGIGDMVSGLIDGTKTMEESIADMLKNIGKRFLEFGINSMMTSALKGLGNTFGFDASSLLGGTAGTDTAAAAATATNTTATTTNTVAIANLTTALSTTSLTGGTGTGRSFWDQLTGGSSGGGTAMDVGGGDGMAALEGASDAMKANTYAMGSDVATFAESSRSTFSDWSSGTTSIFSSLAGTLGSLFGSLLGGGGSSGAGGLLGSLFSGISSLFAKGGAFGRNTQLFAKGGAFGTNLHAFANGGVFDAPHLFKFAKGGSGALGVLGEKGPEAVMPLKKDSKGNLGVAASGAASGASAGAVNIINVTDPNMVLDALGTTAGQKVIMNVIANNPRVLKRISG